MAIPKQTTFWAIEQSAPGAGDRPNAGIEVRALTTKVMKIPHYKNYQGVCVISAALFKIATKFFLKYTLHSWDKFGLFLCGQLWRSKLGVSKIAVS
ncbi:hypothetical protein [Scytonema sp. PCC 10023]|uniref:hypothetical protein n=1 Tax=Scytonema sp. PCC 10023 TaxID=1680591 RepID=UPI0039C5BC6E